MRRVLLILIGASALLLGVQRLRVALASDATRIRWRLEEMQEGFNETRLAACLRGVAPEWRDEGTGLERALLADLLRSLFFHEKDPESGDFPYRVELERPSLEIALDPEREGRAEVTLVARFDSLSAGRWSPTWRVRIEARLEEHAQRGWHVTHTTHSTLESDGRLRRR